MKRAISYIVVLFVGILIFLGIPLLGWGLHDVQQFFNNPARVTYFIIILFLQVFALMYNPQVGKNKGNRKKGIRQHKIDLILIQIFSLSIVFLAPFSDKHSIAVISYGIMVRFIGLLLVIPGFIIMQMAEKHLDKQFSIQVTLQEDHKLIQSGPYKYLRHPRYLGIFAFFLGISITFRSWISMLLVLALFIVFLWRIQAEETLMKQEFGEEWESYRAKSWKFIPFVF